jgi:hypothetical protein
VREAVKTVENKRGRCVPVADDDQARCESRLDLACEVVVPIRGDQATQRQSAVVIGALAGDLAQRGP